jgi:hypothetical protein
MAPWDNESKRFDQFMVEEDSRREVARIRRGGDPDSNWANGIGLAPPAGSSAPVGLKVKALALSTWRRVAARFRHPPSW